MPNLNKFILSLLLTAGSFVLHGQTYLFFQDSPDNGFYEYSWMELTGPSELERMPPDLRKFPVESLVAAHQGVNSLRLKWKSVDGGTWLAIAAGDAWTAKDISSTDTLIIWMQSVEGIASADLPKVFMEDVGNQKGVQIPVPDWSGDLSAGVWTRIAIPMRLFLTSGDGVDYTEIKTIGFTQNAADGVEHTLLLDDMRVNVGDGSADPVTPPEHIAARGYEYHIDISWDPSPGNVSGYQVERSLDGGAGYAVAGLVGEGDTHFIDWVKTLGEGLDLKYRVRSLDAVGTPSEPSNAVDASTASMTDEELLDMVQAYTFRYFWDDAHEASGASRERNTSGNIVTSGGTGFGIMAIPVGIERGFITREEGVSRMLKILNFLETADRFHGAWSHWINGNTGQRIPFGTKDNGGDIVETAYVAQGLLTIRQYFDADNSDEKQIVQKATALWEGIEWDWYRQNDSPSIYWHWSPEYNWDMNMTVSGWNEAAIVYLCAIASPTHGVPASLWNTGWAQSPNYTNGYKYYGHTLYLGNGSSYGGPLFFAHYSFVGFDPRDKADAYTNYFNQNRNHSLIQQAYCKNNPKNHDGYSEIAGGSPPATTPMAIWHTSPIPTGIMGPSPPPRPFHPFPILPMNPCLP